MTTMSSQHDETTSGGDGTEGGHSGGMGYKKLAVTVAIHFLIMWALTYAGVNAVDDIFVNLNRFYMAVLMVSSMVLVMVAMMWKMLPSIRANVAIAAVAALVLAVSFGALRSEALVGNEQFLRSMIPHHSIAIHTCLNADISDAEIAALCDQIVAAQRTEIAQMREILERLDG